MTNVMLFVALCAVCYLCLLSFRKVSLDIKMKLEKTPAYNVIGTMTGREEPGTRLNIYISSFCLVYMTNAY